jgi:parallel beta-helix repeat protein
MRALTPAVLALLLTGCGQGNDTASAAAAGTPAASGGGYEDQLRLALELAQPGDVIQIPAGVHAFTRSLTLNTSGITLRGAGLNDSVLSFSGQIAGAEGLLVTGSDFTIEDLAIEDTVGDALKVNGGRNIVIRRVRTEWTRGPDPDNGAYGIYPVQTQNTLIEDSVAIGASDAGIYVGQSQNVVVRNNRAEHNVAGIEIENTVQADVYGNIARNNTGGILVFNMPDLPMAGHSTRVYGNEIIGNNTPNFGTPGSAVAGVPAGTGIIINSNDKVEIFDNRIGANETANVIVSSLFSAEYSEREAASAFDPYPENIYVYGNRFEPGGSAPDREALDQLRRQAFGDDGRLPDIIWDGIVDASKTLEGASAAHNALCIDNADATFMNVDAGNGYRNPSTDLAPHACHHPKLAAVELSFGG